MRRTKAESPDPRRRGAPRKAAAAKRADLVKLLLTAEEKRTLKAAADRAGLPISAWIRAVALQAAGEGRGIT